MNEDKTGLRLQQTDKYVVIYDTDIP